MAKTPTAWSSNPSAEVSEYIYDSASFTYDSTTQNYDGVVTTDLADTEKIPTAWSET